MEIRSAHVCALYSVLCTSMGVCIPDGETGRVSGPKVVGG